MVSKPTDDRRTEAEIVETGDGVELRPPEARVGAGVPASIAEAVTAALEAAPNTVRDPVLTTSESREATCAVFRCKFLERPAGDGAEPAGWLPPYRSQEDFLEAFDAPDGVNVEVLNNHTIGFYSEVGR
jgi:hypothetical protein